MPTLLHATRRVRASSLAAFRGYFARHAASSVTTHPCLQAFFAFPCEHDLLIHRLVAFSTEAMPTQPSEAARKFRVLSGLVAGDSGSEWEQLFDDGDDHDTGVVHVHVHVHVHGEGSAATLREAAPASVRWKFYQTSAGFARHEVGAHLGGDAASLPMIGLFQRRTLPNRVDDLVESFAPVAHFWQRKIPGCLWASVAKDDEEDDTVWDVRIFADKASYAAHVDDSDAKMTAAMEAW